MIKAYYIGFKRRFGRRSGLKIRINKYYWTRQSFLKAKRGLAKKGINLIRVRW